MTRPNVLTRPRKSARGSELSEPPCDRAPARGGKIGSMWNPEPQPDMARTGREMTHAEATCDQGGHD